MKNMVRSSPWRVRADPSRVGWQLKHAGAVVVAIKAIHTLAWFSIESCMIYLLYAGFAHRSDRRAAVAAAVVGGESLIFAANGFHCPLTKFAQSLGARSGSVTDIYLPRWFARNLPAIHVPFLVLAAFLHGRNLRQRGKPEMRDQWQPLTNERETAMLNGEPVLKVSQGGISAA